MEQRSINDFIRNRRSIYPNMYKEGQIDREIIENLLENANWAPTHKLTEPWRFVVFSGKGLKKFADFQAEVYRKKAEDSEIFDKTKYEKLKIKPLKASHIIAMVMKRDEKERVPEIEEIVAASCAMQNIYLTASANGLGCYFSTGGITYDEEGLEFLGFEKNDRLLGFFYLGKYDGEWPSGKRKPVEDKVRWIN